MKGGFSLQVKVDQVFPLHKQYTPQYTASRGKRARAKGTIVIYAESRYLHSHLFSLPWQESSHA